MRRSSVTVAELRAFLVLARHLSFTEAARQLGVTQPALSLVVRQLETKLGTRLLERSTRSVRLSEAGALLLAPAERLIDNFDRTIAGMQEISRGRMGRITIACPEGVAAHVIAPTLARFTSENPDVSVSVHDGDAASVEHLMHSFAADFGVTGYWKEHPEFSFQPLTKDRCCIICPTAHPLARRRQVKVKDLDGVPIVALNRDAGTRRLIEATCAARGVKLAIQFEVARVSTLIEMVASGLCISVLTELSTPRNAGKGLKVLPFEGSELTYPIGIVTRKKKGLTPAAQRFVEALQDEFAR